MAIRVLLFAASLEGPGVFRHLLRGGHSATEVGEVPRTVCFRAKANIGRRTQSWATHDAFHRDPRTGSSLPAESLELTGGSPCETLEAERVEFRHELVLRNQPARLLTGLPRELHTRSLTSTSSASRLESSCGSAFRQLERTRYRRPSSWLQQRSATFSIAPLRWSRIG